jgi:hypothetical protein
MHGSNCLQVLPPILFSFISTSDRSRAKKLLLFRLLGELSVLIGFTTHTDETLEQLEHLLKRLAVVERVCNTHP